MKSHRSTGEAAFVVPRSTLAAVGNIGERSVGVRAAILAIQAFRVMRLAFFPVKTCRFAPTCTDYAIEALRLHGMVKGSALAFRRVIRCHPFHPGGIDPVPHILP